MSRRQRAPALGDGARNGLARAARRVGTGTASYREIEQAGAVGAPCNRLMGNRHVHTRRPGTRLVATRRPITRLVATRRPISRLMDARRPRTRRPGSRHPRAHPAGVRPARFGALAPPTGRRAGSAHRPSVPTGPVPGCGGRGGLRCCRRRSAGVADIGAVTAVRRTDRDH
jgi:hypothetical protein